MATTTVNIPSLSGVEVKREETRTRIAYIALGVYALTILLVIIVGWAAGKGTLDDTIKILTTVTSILSGIVGAIVGFYFRGKEE